MIEPATKSDFLATKTDLNNAMERLTLRLTIRLGGIMVAGLSLLTALLRLH